MEHPTPAEALEYRQHSRGAVDAVKEIDNARRCGKHIGRQLAGRRGR